LRYPLYLNLEEAFIRTFEHSLGTTVYEYLYVSDENTHESAYYSQLLEGRPGKVCRLDSNFGIYLRRSNWEKFVYLRQTAGDRVAFCNTEASDPCPLAPNKIPAFSLNLL
jgi:hypothetical protein